MSVAMQQPLPRRSATPNESRRPLGRTARRAGLAIFIASVVINAALGIYAVLAPHFGATQGKVLGTSLCVTGAVLLALACEPGWEQRLLGHIPAVAASLATIGFVSTIGLIWIEPAGNTSAKVVSTIFALAVAGVAASLLALAQLAPRHAWVFNATLGLLAVGAGMYGAIPWLEQPGEWFVRSFGVVMIALAAFVVTVPVLHWLDREELIVATPGVRFCPYCGRQLEGDVGIDLTCARCGHGFMVTLSDGEAGPNVNLT